KKHGVYLGQLGIFVWLGVILHHLRSGWGAWADLTTTQIFTSGIDYILFGELLIGIGIVLVYKADSHFQVDSREPLSNLLKTVNAAAAGDTSCLPDGRSNSEVGQLSQAVGRLITVLARSENLVYHQASLIESSSEALVSCALDGTILSWNKGAQRTYGYSVEE